VPHLFPKYSVKRGLKHAKAREVLPSGIDVSAGQDQSQQTLGRGRSPVR